MRCHFDLSAALLSLSSLTLRPISIHTPAMAVAMIPYAAVGPSSQYIVLARIGPMALPS
jgi:multidrug efflux pump subunit AcrB